VPIEDEEEEEEEEEEAEEEEEEEEIRSPNKLSKCISETLTVTKHFRKILYSH
jgi:hypothetical protein